MKSGKRPGLAAALAAIALAWWAAVAAAQQAHINLRDDVYACGGAVDLGADVRGDLVAAGGRIHVGNVQQDVIVAGGKVEIDGDVGDDVRVAGGEVTIAHHVGDHVVAAGGTLHFLPGSHVAGDIIVRAGKVILDGVVDGAVDAGGGDVTLNGTVGGGVRATAKELHVGDHAVIGGNLQYATRGEPDIRAGATIKGLRRRIAEPVSWRAQEHFGRSFRRLLRIFAILRVVALAVGALVAAYVFPRFSLAVADRSIAGFGWSLLAGLGFLCIMPAFALVLAFTLVGFPLALVMGLTWAVFLIGARILSLVVLGTALWRAMTRSKESRVTWQGIAIGATALVLLGFVPFLGTLASLVLLLVALGAISRVAYGALWVTRRGPAAAA